jgi:hypothetical protein
MVIFGAFAKALLLDRSGNGRASPAGLFAGMFVAPGLGWPVGVQEEDRDRLWSWAAPPPRPEVPPGPPVAELIDLDAGGVPVQRVRRRLGS